MVIDHAVIEWLYYHLLCYGWPFVQGFEIITDTLTVSTVEQK